MKLKKVLAGKEATDQQADMDGETMSKMSGSKGF